MKNPQALKQYEELRKSNGDPQQLLNQIMGRYTPEQKQAFIKFANGFGITNEQLNSFGISSK